MFFMRQIVLVSVAIFILSVSAEAITVVAPREIGEKPGYSGEIAGTFARASGNSATVSNDLSTVLHYDTDTVLTTVLINYTYGTSKGETYADKQFIHLRSVYPLKEDESLANEYFMQYNRNLFTHLNERELIGAGIRKKITLGDENRIYFGAGAMGVSEHEKNLNTEMFASWSFYVNNVMKFEDQKKLVSAIYIQPRIADINDFRSIGSIALDIPLILQVGLRFSINAEHDSRPAPGVKSTDIWTNLEFKYSF